MIADVKKFIILNIYSTYFRLLRNLLLTEVVKSGYRPAVLEARGRFSSLFKNGTAVTANFQVNDYCAALTATMYNCTCTDH